MEKQLKISFLFPSTGVYTENRNWLWWVYDALNKIHEVLLNECTEDCDVIIAMSISQTTRLDSFHSLYPKIPIITYNWDWLSFVDKTKQLWPRFTELMKESIDIWTPSKFMVKLMREKLDLEHHVIEACSIPDECVGSPEDKGYVVQASRRDRRYKRFEFFERGCKDLKIPFISCHPDKYSREQYIKILRDCRLLVVATCEDANAALSSIEAAYFKKSLLLSDIEPHKECWGEYALYFKTDDFEDFKDKLKKLYAGEITLDTEGEYDLAMSRYTPKAMALAMDKRLKELWQKL